MLTAVLYPYVYVLGRSAFLGQSRQTLEAARSLGCTYGQSVRRVALPLARPALAAGMALAVMEALADFGTVNLLGVQALTNAIYRVWNGAFDQAAALQLATVLVGLTLGLVAHRARCCGAAPATTRRSGGATRWSRGACAAGARGSRRPARWALLLVVFVAPVAQLVAWSVETRRRRPRRRPTSAGRPAARCCSAHRRGSLAVVAATLLVYGRRIRPSRPGVFAAAAHTLGYAVPGTVVAVAVYVPLAVGRPPLRRLRRRRLRHVWA